MIRYLSDDYAPAWHCRTCEVGWASPFIGPLCWLCRRRGVRGDVRTLVRWWPTEEARRGDSAAGPPPVPGLGAATTRTTRPAIPERHGSLRQEARRG